MNFTDLPVQAISCRVRPLPGNDVKLVEGPVFGITLNSRSPHAFDLRLKSTLLTVRTVEEIDSRRLASELSSAKSTLARMVHIAVDGSFELQVATFPHAALEMGEVEVGVDEYVIDTTSKIDFRADSCEKACRLLEDRCRFMQDKECFFFIVTGPAIDKAMEGNKKEADQGVTGNSADEASNPQTANGEPSREADTAPPLSFCVIGDGVRFVAKEKTLPDGKTVFVTTRLTRRMTAPDRAVCPARGHLKFVDWTQAGRIQILAKAQLSVLTADHSNYLTKWDEYGKVEGDLLLDTARKIGVIHYGKRVENKDGTCSVRVVKASDSALEALAGGFIEAFDPLPDEEPPYLKNPRLSFAEFANNVIEKEKNDAFFQRSSEQRETYQFSEYDSETKTLTLKTETMPSSGSLILSLAGEIAQIKRRMRAREKILEGRSANPQLGVLIAEHGELEAIRRPPKVEALTAFVRNKVFKNPPTVKQEEAIRIALNTPDIALIQGPPGTGKTTVIAAILERLNELADKRKTLKGQVLLTGFQHDAVENMIGRISINSLPVPKFGVRSGEDNARNAFELKMEEMCRHVAEDIRKNNPQLTGVEQEIAIRNACIQYVKAPTHRLAVILAEAIVNLGPVILGENMRKRAECLLKKLRIEENALENPESSQIAAIRNLRGRVDSFRDDGPLRADDALEELREELDSAEILLLEKAATWMNDEPPPFLAELNALKKKLLIRHTTPPVFTVEKHNEDIIELAKEAMEAIRQRGCSAKDKKTAALAEFLEDLEGNPDGMINAVSEYSFAFSATCQQSVNKGMLIQKRIFNSEDPENKLEYDYVIVDEAARVSPRDLMIPMVQGKKIILVGDHRQLPHIIDDEVARQMESGEKGKEESEWLKKSMFEYLFSERLKELEKRDNIQRTVTLDKQYRMHPVLGDFVSRNFYERFDPDEKFASGLPAESFAHHLPETDGKPAVWLEVSSREGAQERSGTSWIRRAEASAIASQLKKWVKSEAGQNLTFGVISFYKAQADLIKRYFQGTYDEKKLKIGTVDSFQGMEFDVVFLSMVRTKPVKFAENDNVSHDVQARRLFGHLCLYNRLNVSMSRQKKLLAVVGDSSLLEGDLAMEFIPGLVDFHRLCENEGVVLQCR